MTNTGIKNFHAAITDIIRRHSGVLKLLLPVVCAFLFVSCATTRVTNVWKDKAYEGKAKKIVVIMVAKDPDIRKLFEGRFSAELDARGNDSIPSYSLCRRAPVRRRPISAVSDNPGRIWKDSHAWRMNQWRCN